MRKEEETKKIVSIFYGINVESNKLHIKCIIEFPIAFALNEISYNSTNIKEGTIIYALM